MTAERTCNLAPFVAQVVAQKGDLESAASAVELLVQQLELFLTQFKAAVCDDLAEIVAECCGGGPSDLSFLDLTDTPSSYAGAAGDLVRVNATEDGLEFWTLSVVLSFLDLDDTPASYAGFGGQAVAVNVGETGLEFTPFPTPASVNNIPSKFIHFVRPTAGTGILAVGSGAGTVVSAGAAVFNPAVATTNFNTSHYHARLTSAAGANAGCNFRMGTLLVCLSVTGFYSNMRMGTASAINTQRAFWGLTASTTQLAANVDPSSYTNIIGAGYDSGDTTLHILHNDAAGTATKVNLGANFPVDATTVFEIELTNALGSSDVTYTVTNLSTGTQATGTLSTNLPATTQFLATQVLAGNGATGGAALLELFHMYLGYEP